MLFTRGCVSLLAPAYHTGNWNVLLHNSQSHPTFTTILLFMFLKSFSDLVLWSGCQSIHFSDTILYQFSTVEVSHRLDVCLYFLEVPYTLSVLSYHTAFTCTGRTSVYVTCYISTINHCKYLFTMA